MAKQALLIGCDYPGTRASLLGCVNDAHMMKKMLKQHYGFKDEDITIMADTDESAVQPNAKNIKESLASMVKGAKSGDTLYVHFSGHGVQVPADEDSDEEDGMDEAIVPTDMNLILDDDLKAIVKDMVDGVAFTFTTDCCHSGGMLDHKEVQLLEEEQDEENVFGPILNMFGMKNWVSGADRRNRSLSPEDYLGELGKKAGRTIEKGNIRAAIGSVFGGDSSIKFQNFITSAHDKRFRDVDLGNDSKQSSCWTAFRELFGGSKAKQNSTEKPLAGKSGAQPASLNEHLGILITGCQSNEKSADADPPRNDRKAKPQGAMTNALVGVVNSHFKLHPGKPISNINLVKTVRKTLEKAGFLQTPSLEGSAKNAAAAFVTWENIPAPTAGTQSALKAK